MLAFSTPQHGCVCGFLSRQVVFFLLNSFVWLGFFYVGLTVSKISPANLPNIASVEDIQLFLRTYSHSGN